MRVIHWVLYGLAALAFVVPAIYLVQIWPQKSPPPATDVDRARVEASTDGYLVILPNGARYGLARSNVNGRNRRSAALAHVHSQLSDEYSSYSHAWARFWFILAAACGVAMLLTLVSQLVGEALSLSRSRSKPF